VGSGGLPCFAWAFCAIKAWSQVGVKWFFEVYWDVTWIAEGGSQKENQRQQERDIKPNEHEKALLIQMDSLYVLLTDFSFIEPKENTEFVGCPNVEQYCQQ